jgi:hypothetical protein
VAPTNAVDMPFMSDDLLDASGNDSYPWWFVRSSDGSKHAAFACEEDALIYVAARASLPTALDEIERLRTALVEACDHAETLRAVHEPDDEHYDLDEDSQRGYRERVRVRISQLRSAVDGGGEP